MQKEKTKNKDPEGHTRGDKITHSEAHSRAVEILGLGKAIGPDELTELASLRSALALALEQQKEEGDAEEYRPYPSIQDPDFASKIVAKKEFSEHAVEARKGKRGCSSNDPANKFELTRTQLIVRNFLAPGTPYSGLLLFHGVGLGKSCSAVSVAEQCLDLGAQTKVLVITRPGLRENFRKTVFDMSKVARNKDGSLDYASSFQCTGTKYLDRVPNRGSITDEQVDTKIDRMIRSRYEFMGVGEFANVVEALGSGPASLAVDKLRKRFSNLVMIVDEAHNLRIGRNESDAKEQQTRGGKKATPALRRVLRCTENVKLLLLTATPMFNRSADVIDLINLLLANDKRLPIKTTDVFDKDGNLTRDGEAKLRAAARGYISYAAINDPFSFPMRLWPSRSNDPTVLRPKDVPTIDIRGDLIPPHLRLFAGRKNGEGIEIVTSPLGKMQREAYMKIEDNIRAVAVTAQEEDEEDDGDEGEEEGGRLNSALYNGLQLCNVAFPNGLKFDGCFKKYPVGSGSVQMEYRANVPRFLEPSKIPMYSPKIAMIVDRIRSSAGIVMVYSRFLYSGLIPLAIALEHVGFRKFESSPMLRGSMGPRGHGGGHGRGDTYAIISGNREFRTDESKTVKALISADNRDGHVLKVILVSDRGSEGIDLKNVREVHVMEPWFHLNKIEQVVGRAARFCSHSALPPEDRNLTVYLHAISNPSSEKETIDLRTYRLAEHKDVQIKKTEKVLRSVSIDCRLREVGTRSALSEAAATRVRVKTSQGVELRNVPLLSSHSLVALGECEGSPNEGSPNPKTDESTYDPTGKHAFHHETYSNLLKSYFSETGRPTATFDDLVRHVAHSMNAQPNQPNLWPGEITERTATELDLLIRRGTQIEGPNGKRPGTLIHRGDLYLFQPNDEDTHVLTDAERAAKKKKTSESLDLALLRHKPSEAVPSLSRANDRRGSRLVRAAEQALIGLDTDVSSLLSRTQLGRVGAYRNVAVDFVVDRLSHVRLVRLATACVTKVPSLSKVSDQISRQRYQATKYLRRSGRLVFSSPSTATLVSPYLTEGRVVRIDLLSGVATEEVDAKIVRDSAKKKQRVVAKEVVGAVVALPHEGRAVFKVLEDRLTANARDSNGDEEVRMLADGGRGSGCVCHQSSVLSSDRFIELIAKESRGEPTAVAASTRVTDKRTMCELFELVLRKHRANGLLPM